MQPTLVPFFTSCLIISGFVFRFFVSLHRPFSDFFPTVRLWRDRKRPAKTWQDIFVSCFETSYSSLTRRLPVNFSSQSDFDSSAFRPDFDIDYPRIPEVLHPWCCPKGMQPLGTRDDTTDTHYHFHYHRQPKLTRSNVVCQEPMYI